MNEPTPAAKSKEKKAATKKKQDAGPKSRLVPLLAILGVVVIAAGVFLFVTGGDSGDEETPAQVAGTTVERTATTVAANSPAPTTAPAGESPSTSAAAAPPETTPTTAATAPPVSLTATQQRELCHIAFVGVAEGKSDTGDPLETCTSQDWMSVGLEVSIYLHGDPNQDRAAMLKAECDARRAVGASPRACEGI